MRPPRMSITARAGRWSARHRKAAILGWIACVAVAVFSGFASKQHTLSAEQAAVGDSGRAARMAGSAFPRHAKEVVLVQSRTMTETIRRSAPRSPTSSPGYATPASRRTFARALPRRIATQRLWRSTSQATR